MIKKFETYINEDYFSKLANRKDNGNTRKENELTEDDVRSIFRDSDHYSAYDITFRKENGKTVVDIVGNFYLKHDIEEIPFQFGRVTGNFNCACSKLTTLKGCPKEVGGYFYCYDCKKLESIEGCPEKVGDNFFCYSCKQLKSLEGCPKEIGGEFDCSDLYITSLKGCPEKVVGDFICTYCDKLTSLEGGPKEVGGSFVCFDCKKQFTADEVRKICNVHADIRVGEEY